MSSPAPNHQKTVYATARAIEPPVTKLSGQFFVAPLDVEFDPRNVPQPDVMLVLPDGRCTISATRLVGAPDLIVEVLSLDTKQLDRREKFRLYERHGVREYWMLDPSEMLLEAWALHDGRFVLMDVVGKSETYLSPLLGEITLDTVFGS
jgi:Uma2 family endonuclease